MRESESDEPWGEWGGWGSLSVECDCWMREWKSLMSHEVSGVYELFEMTNSLWYSAEVHNITFEVWIKGVGNEHGWALGTHAWSGWAPLHERWMRDRVSIGGEKFMIWTEVHNIRELKYVTVYMYMNVKARGGGQGWAAIHVSVKQSSAKTDYWIFCLKTK